MGIKEVLAKMSEKKRLKKEQVKAMSEQIRMERMVQDRLKGSDERELERFYEEERQKQIKQNLEEFRKQKKKELWEGNMFTNNKNIFKGHTNILTDNKKLFSVGKGTDSMRNKSKVKKQKGGNLYFN